MAVGGIVPSVSRSLPWQRTLVLVVLVITGTSCKDLGERLSREVNRTVRDNARVVEEGVLRDGEKARREAGERLGTAKERGRQALQELEREASKVLGTEDCEESPESPPEPREHRMPPEPNPRTLPGTGDGDVQGDGDESHRHGLGTQGPEALLRKPYFLFTSLSFSSRICFAVRAM